MDGCVDMAIKLTENLLLVISLLKETIAYALPAELNESMQYFWGGFVGLSGWLGYFLAAFYYIGVDYEFGEDMCEVLGYGYYVVDGINYIIAFAKPTEEEGAEATDEEKAAAA